MNADPDADDPSVTDEERLLRRLDPVWVVPDGCGGQRPSTQAFTDKTMSVDIESMMAEAGRSIDDLLTGYEDFLVAGITAGLARECGQSVRKNPLPENAAHGLVVGQKTKSVRNRLAKGAVWLRPPR